jgi:membrane-bound lytic murein transglycosylase A
MQSIRAWLRANPDRAASVLNRNRSFVFFRELQGDGPIGAQGVALTANRSLAVDRAFLPLGVPIWLMANDPGGALAPIQRLMVTQDTGGAIRGPVRGDVFMGWGDAARNRAGKMRMNGQYWILLPVSISKQTAGVQ